MENSKIKPHINPYIGGVLLGIVLLSAYFFAGEGLGASGAFKNGIAACVSPIVKENSFFGNTYKSLMEDHGKWWIVLEVVGVLIGGFLSGALSGRLKFKVEHSPKITSKRRLIFALLGGVFFGIGSQFGRGCTSGAALSGMASLSVAGFLTMICIFGTGYAMAYFFRKNWI
ncbi:MAG: YeeE/YedE thiosulfate transporter family protein [Bacteroidota bacterium]